MNKKARTKVSLNTSFSRPLRLKDALPPPNPPERPKPVPRACIRISAIRPNEIIICSMVKICFTSSQLYPKNHLNIQCRREETKDIRKENAIKARIPVSVTAGIENQYEENPLKAKSKSLNPGTTSVTI